ncbi:MAG TPA: DUF3365 domain-containing protein [Lacunisphaera sp.]|jgi:hypothetical protein|nr:DUF3365 domain-containing protein [Lacunisphaera sp.]
MTKKTLTLLIAVPALTWTVWAQVASEKTNKLTSISPQAMADALHAVIAADRQAYAELVDRVRTGTNPIDVSENWRETHGLPVPAQLLRNAAQSIQKEGAEFSYALRSQWAINPSHTAQTVVEQKGLEFVAQHPGQTYYADEELGGRSYFTAVYPDRATLPSCVDCHNRDPRSPRHDFKPGDIMGAIVVRVPLEF